MQGESDLRENRRESSPFSAGRMSRVDSEPEATSALSDRPAVVVRDLVKTYSNGADEVVAVDGIDFTIQPGTAVGMLGPNGAGKTTVIKSILSLLIPTSGHISVAGIDVGGNPTAAQKRMGAMLEGARNVYWRLTVRENLQLFSVLGGKSYQNRTDDFENILTRFNIEQKSDTVVRKLSRGQKQKVSLACTMIQEPDIVFLDEPTLGLDVESSLELQRELRHLVQNRNVTILLSTHDMEIVQAVCDRVVIINDGAIVADDSINNLLGVFNTQAYEITVTGEIAPIARRRLKSNYHAKGFETRQNETRFQARVIGDEFYYMIDALRTAELSIKSLESTAPDLKEAFLDIVTDDEN